MNKEQTLKKIAESQDGKPIKHLLDPDEETDNLSRYIGDVVRRNDSEDEVKWELQYAIRQLERAVAAL